MPSATPDKVTLAVALGTVLTAGGLVMARPVGVSGHSVMAKCQLASLLLSQVTAPSLKTMLMLVVPGSGVY